ncbi:MAG: NAD(P)/FAD-dependent oxidoreductase [Planctomycetota bacterium]
MPSYREGYTVPGLLHDTDRFRKSIASSLDLTSHGLSWREESAAVVGPSQKGPGLRVGPDDEATERALKDHSPADVEAWRQWRALLDKLRPLARELTLEPPPEVATPDLSELFRLAKKGWALRRLGSEVMIEVLRVAPMCLADWLGERFVSRHLQALLAAPGLLGTWMGPWSAGSTTTFLLEELTRGRAVSGGPAAIAAALRSAAEKAGAEIRTSAAVQRIRIENGRVHGVVLENGEPVEAPFVLSTTDPKRTILDLLHPADVDADLAQALTNYRVRGVAAKVHLALSGPLELRHHSGERIERLRTGEDVDDLERAFDAVKYRQCSERPILDVSVPTIETPGLAPKGHHIVSILAHYAPYDLEGGWTDEKKQAFGDRVIDVLAEHAPKLKERIVARQVLSPADLEGEYGLTGGHLYHGEHALDQLLFLRPVIDCAHYTTPIEGLILGGSGSHPGGGLTGAPGWLAAGTLL